MQKGLQLRTGQTHVQRYTRDLLNRIEKGEIDTTTLISHRLPLEQAPDGYKNFKHNPDEYTKVVLKPKSEAAGNHVGGQGRPGAGNGFANRQ